MRKALQAKQKKAEMDSQIKKLEGDCTKLEREVTKDPSCCLSP